MWTPGGCPAYVTAHPEKCLVAVEEKTIGVAAFCVVARYTRIFLKGGQIGLSVLYTENKTSLNLDVVALFDEQLILANSIEFEGV